MIQVPYSPTQWLYEELELTDLIAEESILDQVEVYGCEITRARLRSATLKRWVFEACTFRDCDLSNINWEGCTFIGCHFIDCRFIGSDWRQVASLVAEVNFERCDLSLSHMSGIALRSSRFEHCKCIDTDFSRSDLSESSWSGTEVTDALFEETKLMNANLSGAIGERFDPNVSVLSGATVSVATAIRLVEMMGLTVERS